MMSMRRECVVCCCMKRHLFKMFLSMIFTALVVNDACGYYHDSRHGDIQMGVSNDFCDNGKDHLEKDNSLKEVLSSCSSPYRIPLPSVKDRSKVESYCTDVEYTPLHKCMAEEIHYKEPIPLSGPHRPLWPVYGEYSYLPPQRWVHSLEHGAAVFLYHPCANKTQIQILKLLARSCLRKHIVTPYNLTEAQPFAIVTWLCIMKMDRVDTNLDRAVYFIQNHAMKAMEKDVVENGQYRVDLIRESTVPYGSDREDSNVCPFYALSQMRWDIRSLRLM